MGGSICTTPQWWCTGGMNFVSSVGPATAWVGALGGETDLWKSKGSVQQWLSIR